MRVGAGSAPTFLDGPGERAVGFELLDVCLCTQRRFVVQFIVNVGQNGGLVTPVLREKMKDI